MKKTLTAAITSALAIGVASVTFAAANPFSDVPTNHWSFDAVAKLAQEGVIEGYGDNTFRGDAHITRYEMAQMVAKAMAREDVSAADKATIDKLAAEYAEELNNLGVRVANLEKKSDNVQISGLMRLDGAQKKIDDKDDDNTGTAMLRLNIKAKVNEDWNVRGRIEGKVNLDEDNTTNNTTIQHVYAEGPLFGAKSKLGRFGELDMAGLSNEGLLIDSKATGAQFAFGNTVKAKLTYGTLNGSTVKDAAGGSDATYSALELMYKASDKFKFGAAYFDANAKNGAPFDGDDNNGIWELGFDYAFNPDFTFGAIYAGSNVDGDGTYGAANNGSDQEKSYSVQMTYKGAESKVVGSYGAWLAYRQIGKLASFAPTYNGVGYGEKGIEVGVEYMLDKNILTKIVYFDGEEVGSGKDASKLFGRVEFQF